MSITVNEILSFVSLYSIRIIGSVFIFVIGKKIARLLSRLSGKLIKRTKVDVTLARFCESAVHWALIVFVVLAALSNLGIETTSFIALLGAVGLAIGMAFKDTFSNLGAGVLIVLFRPFKVGDFVDISGIAGTIEEVNLFSTFILSSSNIRTIIPNSKAISDKITNYSTKTTRRVDLEFGVSYEDDLKKVKTVLNEIVSSDNRVLQNPKPFVAVSALADSSVNLLVRLWVNNVDYWNVYFDTIEKVKLTFDQEGISFPYPQLDINNKQKNK